MATLQRRPQFDFSATWLILAGSLAGMHVLLALFARNPQVLRLASNTFNPIIGLLSVVLIGTAAVGLWRISRRRALVWGLLALAQLSSSAGDIAWTVYEMVLFEVPTPSIADVFYLLFYLLFLTGVMFIPIHRASGSDWLKGTIDVLIVLLTAFLALWAYLLGPLVTANAGQTLIYQVVMLVYPLGDILLLWAMLIVLFLAVGYPLRRSLWLVVAGLTVFIVSDIGYAYLSLEGAYATGAWTDAGYSAAYFLLALAGYAEVQWVRHPRETPARAYSALPLWVQTLPYVWVVFAYWILVRGAYVDMHMSTGRLTLLVGVITALVLLRQIVSLYENARLSASLAQALRQVKQQATDLERTNHEMHGEIIERRRMAERLSYDALHDGLTGLPNRALFLDRLAQAAKMKRRQPARMYSVMFLDLDGFKLVNDSLGHFAGDRLLIRVAWIISSCLRATDTVARMGGDEFVILVEDTADTQSVLDMATRVQSELRQPILLEDTQVYISASIGVVLNAQGSENPEDLLRDADLAMYQAKGNGKARYAIFDPSMHDSAVSRLALESELRRALDSSAFYLEYQPTFHLSTGRLVGFEALLRWQHPERGRVEPGEFVHVAEDCGLILPIGKWCLDESCRQGLALQTRFAHLGTLKMSVNVSGRQLKDPAFIGQVVSALATSGLPGDHLIVEVTETACFDSLDSLREALLELQALGVEVQIDDFGTGYSALSYLQSLPVQAIKLDRSFVDPIRENGDHRPLEIVNAVLAMARSLGIEVTAEGIETAEQLAVLTRLGCTLGQGYYLAYPMEFATLETWLTMMSQGQFGK